MQILKGIKKLAAVFLTAIMAAGLLPVTAFAASGDMKAIEIFWDGNMNFEFEVRLPGGEVDTSVNGVYGELTFANGRSAPINFTNSICYRDVVGIPDEDSLVAVRMSNNYGDSAEGADVTQPSYTTLTSGQKSIWMVKNTSWQAIQVGLALTKNGAVDTNYNGTVGGLTFKNGVFDEPENTDHIYNYDHSLYQVDPYSRLLLTDIPDGYELFVTDAYVYQSGDLYETTDYGVFGFTSGAADDSSAEDAVLSFDKYLVMDQYASVPNLGFSFSVTTPAEKDTYTDNGKLITILPGVGEPVIADTVFAYGDATQTAVAQGDHLTLAAGKKYAKKTATIDFSGVTFPEPGVYRYFITEDYAENSNRDASEVLFDIEAEGSKRRVLDVYVMTDWNILDISNGQPLYIAGGVLHQDEDVRPLPIEPGSTEREQPDKSYGFVNEYKTEDLVISKTVSGNQASADKYFHFTGSFSTAKGQTAFTVDLTNADAVSGTTSATIEENRNKANPETITSTQADNATGTFDFYLQGGQQIVIKGIPHGVNMTIAENQEDYKPSVQVAGDASAEGRTGESAEVVINTGTTGNNSAAFTNTRDGVIPTGTHSAVWPFIILAVIGGFGLAARRKKTL